MFGTDEIELSHRRYPDALRAIDGNDLARLFSRDWRGRVELVVAPLNQVACPPKLPVQFVSLQYALWVFCWHHAGVEKVMIDFGQGCDGGGCARSSLISDNPLKCSPVV